MGLVCRDDFIFWFDFQLVHLLTYLSLGSLEGLKFLFVQSLDEKLVDLGDGSGHLGDVLLELRSQCRASAPTGSLVVQTDAEQLFSHRVQGSHLSRGLLALQGESVLLRGHQLDHGPLDSLEAGPECEVLVPGVPALVLQILRYLQAEVLHGAPVA